MQYHGFSHPYETLGVNQDADNLTIRKAHRKLVLKYHPDRFQGEDGAEGGKIFSEVQQAYEILSDETRRQRHDERAVFKKLRQEREHEYATTYTNEYSRHKRYERPLYAAFRDGLRSTHKRRRENLENRTADIIGKERYASVRTKPYSLYTDDKKRSHFIDPTFEDERHTRRPKKKDSRTRGDEERQRYHHRVRKEGPELIRKSSRRPIRSMPSSKNGIRGLEQRDKYRRQEEIWKHQILRTFGVPPPIPKRSAKKHTHGILALEGFINDKFVCTNPDTGAQANLIALSFAESIGLQVLDREPDSQVGFRMANGSIIYSIGRAIARWCFKEKSSKSYEISFYVFAECGFDVVIGDPFLRATQTMSANEHRLSWIPRPKWALSVRHINLVGCPSQHMKGKLSGEEVFALPDSGAEGGNLVSYEYAKRRGWLYSDLSGERNLLQFPDGSQSRTEGQVRKVWRYHGAAGYEKKIDVVFDVLYDLPFDVILGQDFLKATDAFTKHEKCFHDITTDNDCLGFSLVTWKAENNDQASEVTPATSPSPLEQEAEDELERRATNNQKIRKLKDNAERESAKRNERIRIDHWERAHPDIWRPEASPGSGSYPMHGPIGTQPLPARP